MSSISDRLREMADLFEAQHAPHNLVLHLRAGADEIERLRAGGCARDQGLTQYCAEAAEKDARIRRMALEYLQETGQLIDRIGELNAENEHLRLALLTISGHPELYNTKGYDIARAALTQPAEENSDDKA
jgi:hypothetical protein